MTKQPSTRIVIADDHPLFRGALRQAVSHALAGAEVSAHFDSMLVKLTCRGRDLQSAARRAYRALTEFRIRGVSTNIGFLEAVITDPDFLAGRATTSTPRRRSPHAPPRLTLRLPRPLASPAPASALPPRPTRRRPPRCGRTSSSNAASPSWWKAAPSGGCT